MKKYSAKLLASTLFLVLMFSLTFMCFATDSSQSVNMISADEFAFMLSEMIGNNYPEQQLGNQIIMILLRLIRMAI